MTTEERLRDTTHAYADPIDPSPDAWNRIRARLEPPPRSRKPVAWAIAAAVILAVAGAGVLALVRSGGDDSGVETVPPEAAAGMPSEIVAVTTDGRVVVLDSTTGAEIRTIVEDAYDVTPIATTAERVFFTQRRGEPDPDSGCFPRDVVSVPLSGGPVQTIAQSAEYPAVSPDGRYLAFRPASRCIETDTALFVVDLMGIEETRSFSVSADPASPPVSFSWAVDSRHLIVEFIEGRDGLHQRLLETSGDTALEQAPLIAIPDGCMAAGSLGKTEWLGACEGHRVNSNSWLDVVAIDPAGGASQRVRELFRIPAQGFQNLQSDTTGRHVIGIGGPPRPRPLPVVTG